MNTFYQQLQEAVARHKVPLDALIFILGVSKYKPKTINDAIRDFLRMTRESVSHLHTALMNIGNYRHNGPMTWQHVLELMLHYKHNCPCLLDKPAVFTFGNNEAGNAEVFQLVNTLSSGEVRVSGTHKVTGDVAAIVGLLEKS